MPENAQKNNLTKEDNGKRDYKAETERLKVLLNISSDGLYEWNIRTQEIYLSSKLLESLGYKTDEIPDLHNFWFSIIHTDDLIFFKNIIDEYNNGSRNSHEYEYRVMAKTGEWRSIFSSGRLIKRDADGRPARIIGMHTDITAGKKIAVRLAESEEKFYNVFHMSLDPFTIATFTEGRFLDVNDAFLKMHGFSREEVLNKTAVELGLWDPSRPRDSIIKLVVEKGSIKDVELEMCKKDGSKIFGLFSCSIINLSTGPMLFSVFRDLTERKRALDLFRIQKDISIALAGATELKEVGDIVLNAVTKLESIDSGSFHLRNTETGELFLIAHIGFSKPFIGPILYHAPDTDVARDVAKGELTSKTYLGINLSKDDARFKEGIKLSFLIPVKYEDKVVAVLFLRSHSHYEVSDTIRDSIEAIAGLLGNCISRIRNESAVREINARLKSVLESPQDISIYSLDRNYCYTSFNERHKNQMIADNDIEIKIGTSFIEAVRNLVIRNEIKQDFEIALKGNSIIKKNEISGKFFNITINPIIGEDRKVIGISCFVQDITYQELSEKVLSESEKKYSTIFETAAEGILIADISTKKINYANPMMCSMLEYTLDELIGKNVGNIHPKESLPHVIAHFEAIARGELEIAASIPCLRKDGTVFWADIRGSILNIKGVNHNVGFFTDITERKQAIDILHIQKDMSIALAGAVELKEVGDIVLNAAMKLERIDSGSFHSRNTDTGELFLIAHVGLSKPFIGPISYFAPDTEVVRNVAKGELASKSYLGINLPKNKPHFKEGIKLSFMIPVKHEDKVVAVLFLASHSHYEVSDTIRDSIEAIAGMLGNCISRIRNESSIREINARLNSIMESPKDISIYSLDPNYCLTSFNEDFKNFVSGFFDKEIKNGLNILDTFKTPELRKKAKEEFDRALKGESLTKSVKVLESFRDITISPVFGEKQKVIGISCFSRDITKQKDMEEKLRQSEKMEAIGQLAGGIAHDFNNELSIISGYAELLRDEVKNEPDMVSYTDSILQGIKRSANLISQMLAFSRKGKYLLSNVDIHEIITEIITMLKHSIDKRIKIGHTLMAIPSTTLGDPTQLKSAILNLAINARDAMPNGGELLFSTENIDIHDEIYKSAPYYIELGKYIIISVTDTGMGMDKQTQNRLFEPFFTTKARGKGTGFGLASVYGTVKNHKGMINVYSESGHGTTFKVYLPLAEEILKTKEKIKTEPVKPVNISASILLVDDEDHLRIVAEKILIKLGYNVSVCKNGKEAVKFYKKYWKKIDLVILDMVMPVMNGRDAFIAMKKINPAIKSLLTSGYSLNGEAQAILDKGVKGFLQKPFKKEDLSYKISNLLGAGSKSSLSLKSKKQKSVKKKSDKKK